MNLVLLETSGNQSYIFATNKLRENVGASELTAQVGMKFVLDAVSEACVKKPENLRNPDDYPVISSENPVEVILAVSGKALLLVSNEELGWQIVRAVTLRALREAPGLEVRGVVSGDFDFDSEKPGLHTLVGEVHRKFEAVRSRLPGPAARFQRLPIVAECASSGLPAQRVANRRGGLAEEERTEYSAQTFAKLQAREQWKSRLDGILNHHNSSAKLPDATTDLEKLGYDWLAIVHADGNGLGQVFLKFNDVAQTNGNRDYIEKLRMFSLALDECTEKAFCHSLDVFRAKDQNNITPIVPLVLGGDDLTVVCDGRQALQFTKKFIDCFEEETRRHPAINTILKDGVKSCAGVAIVKPHFPFFAGYQLAEELLKSAKKLKPHSAIDYHILYDSSGPDLGRIRRDLTLDGNTTVLVARPYLVNPKSEYPGRCWKNLEDRINAVLEKDEDDRRRLPSSLLHDLREALFLGRQAAEARLGLVRDRYIDKGLGTLLSGSMSPPSLFWEEEITPIGTEGKNIHRTALLDAVDTAEFWQANKEAQ